MNPDIGTETRDKARRPLCWLGRRVLFQVEQMEYDAVRTQWLNEQHHNRVSRFTNREVLTNIEAVIETIRAALAMAV